MNDNYAIHPDCAISDREWMMLMRQFKEDSGRFILDFPTGWFSEVKNQLHNVTDIQRRRIFEVWMRVIRHSILPTSQRYMPQLPWEQNAANLINEVRAIVGPSGSKPPLRQIADLLLDPEAFPDSSEKLIPRKPEAYAAVARPLFQTSSKIVLVDRNFRLRHPKDINKQSIRHHKALKALLEGALKEKKVEIFALTVSRESSMTDIDKGRSFEDDIQYFQEAIVNNRLKIEYRLLDEKIPYTNHARYLLGNSRGLNFDYGFDVDIKGSSTNHVSWLGKSALDPLLDRYF